MKRLMIAAALLCVLPLAGCNFGVNSPGSVAAATKLDQQIGIGAESAYTASALLGSALARAGLIDAAKFKAFDQGAYAALLASRSAYRAGNAADYAAAVAQVHVAVAQIKSLVK